MLYVVVFYFIFDMKSETKQSALIKTDWGKLFNQKFKLDINNFVFNFELLK